MGIKKEIRYRKAGEGIKEETYENVEDVSLTGDPDEPHNVILVKYDDGDGNGAIPNTVIEDVEELFGVKDL